jgi:dihydrofolate reductase
MKLEIVVAMGLDRAIGQQGNMPWHLPEDLKNFQKLTSGHPIIMGRKTFESLGRVLKDRPHFVLSKLSEKEFLAMAQALPNASGQPVLQLRSLEELHGKLNGYFSEKRCKSNSEELKEEHSDIFSKVECKAFIIGGAELYEQVLERNWVDAVHITEIDSRFEKADTFFPKLSTDTFMKESESLWFLSEKGLRYRVLYYGKRKNE